jgi:hypothetical protein
MYKLQQGVTKRYIKLETSLLQIITKMPYLKRFKTIRLDTLLLSLRRFYVPIFQSKSALV